jgi:hypothetical protein
VGKTDLHIAPQQCAGSSVAPDPQLTGKTSDIRCAPSTLFSGLSPRRLFPVYFLLFPKIKTNSKGRRLQTIEKIKENAIKELRAITESAFQEAFKQWKKRWERCTASRWDYFKGDSA